MRPAVIFDMDGVIVDSELQWKRAAGAFLRGLVPAWTEHDDRRIVGLGVVDLYHWLQENYRIAGTKEGFLEECDRLAVEVYGRRVSLTPGFSGLLESVAAAGVPIGLASSSPRHWIAMVLERFGLGPRLGAVVSADDVQGRTKPLPDIYLEACRRLGREPSGCVAIEDSVYGLRSAKSAGLSCAGLRNGSNDEQDFSSADLVLPGLAGLDYEALISRLKRA